MVVFIAGSRNVYTLPEKVIEKINSICEKEFEILIGDATGIDTLIQIYLNSINYKYVTVYTSNIKPRNNIGGWSVKRANVPPGIKTGFEFHAVKDAEMANDCDCGFMIKNGNTRGTTNDIRMLTTQNKKIVIYDLKDESIKYINLKK